MLALLDKRLSVLKYKNIGCLSDYWLEEYLFLTCEDEA